MKFLIDADLPNSTVEPFRDKDFEAVSVREIGLGASSDAEISSYANENGYVVVTRDSDFGNPLLSTKVDSGLIILKLHNYSPNKLKGRISVFLNKIDKEEIKDSLIVVEKSKYRISKY
jgi:predicted nuclease of predicted toxin-antitoxin system